MQGRTPSLVTGINPGSIIEVRARHTCPTAARTLPAPPGLSSPPKQTHTHSPAATSRCRKPDRSFTARSKSVRLDSSPRTAGKGHAMYCGGNKVQGRLRPGRGAAAGGMHAKPADGRHLDCLIHSAWWEACRVVAVRSA